MNESLEIIQRIGQKAQQLTRQRDALQREKEKLQQELNQRLEQQAELKEKLTYLEDQVAILKAATMQLDEKGKKDFEKRIGGFIRDIDKVIAHLQA
jgi:chromosome segregation ATPase